MVTATLFLGFVLLMTLVVFALCALYAKADSKAFEDLVAELCATEEWKYAEREIGIRMVREDG